MDDYAVTRLVKMYDDCLAQYKNKKINSLWAQVIISNANTNKNAVKDAAYYSDSNSLIMRELLEKGFVQEFEPNYYSLTAEGILYVETEVKKLNDDSLVEWVNKKLLLSLPKISDKNRVILLAVFAARAFSEPTAISYNSADQEEAFLSLISESRAFLVDNGIIGNIAEKTTGGKSKTEISSLLGQIDELQAGSKMYFKATKKRAYYLQASKNGAIKQDAITDITKIILGSNISFDLLSSFKQFCDDSFMQYGPLFRTVDESFDDTMSDIIISSGIDGAMI